MFQTLRSRDQVEGSGVGLAMVKKIVESLGGAITLDSAEGEGTRISFSWPVLAEPAGDRAATGALHEEVA